MGNQIQSVFISSTTQDLGSCRNAVKEEFLTANILPVSQSNFSPDHRNLKEFLQHEISKCDAVFCLVGFLYGDAPKDENEYKLSYSQLEYEYAIKYKKPLFIFLADKELTPDQIIREEDEKKELQELHRKRLITSNHKWETFSDIHDLRIKIAQACRKINKPLNSTPIYYRHLPRKPVYFAGRTMEIEQMENALLANTPALVVVLGMGGQGKTTLVHKVLLDMKSSPFCAGFWCTAYRGGFTFDMFLDEVLQHFLKVDFDKTSFPDINSRICKLIDYIQQHPVLIVVDGIERWLWGWNSGIADPQFVDTIKERTSFYEGMDELLQQISSLDNGTHLIITSRALPAVLDQIDRKHIPVIEENGENLCLEGIDRMASIDLLKKLGVKGTLDELAEISESYANHPLSLTVLGTLLKKKYDGKIHPIKIMNPYHDLYKLFDEIRVDLPGRENAELFLKVVSQCIENPSLEVISAGIKGISSKFNFSVEILLENAVMLADWNLIWWNGADQSVSLHPIIKNYFGSLLSKDETTKIHAELSIWYGKQTVSNNAHLLEDVKSRILAIKHAGFAGDYDYAEELIFTPLIKDRSLFTWFSSWGHQFTAIDVLEQLINTEENELRGIILLAQAQMYHQLDRPEMALEKAEKARAIFEDLRIYGYPEILNNLVIAFATKGNIYREIGSSSEAIKNFNSAIEIIEKNKKIFEDNPIDLAKTLVNRANALRGIGNLSLAKLDLDAACEIWEKLLKENPKLGERLLPPTLLNRGILFIDINKIDLAIADLENAITISDQHLLNDDDQEVIINSAHAKSMLGLCFMHSKQNEKASIFANEAVSIFKQLSDGGRTDSNHLLALSLLNRAEVFISLKQYSDALDDCDETVLIYTRMVMDSGIHFSGALAHTHYIRGLVRYKIGDKKGSKEDRQIGLDIAKQLFHKYEIGYLINTEDNSNIELENKKQLYYINKWSSESEIRVEFFRDAIRMVNYLLSENKEESEIIIDELLDEIDRSFLKDESSEWLRNELYRSVPILEKLIHKLGTDNYRKESIKKLVERVGLFKS